MEQQRTIHGDDDPATPGLASRLGGLADVQSVYPQLRRLEGGFNPIEWDRDHPHHHHRKHKSRRRKRAELTPPSSLAQRLTSFSPAPPNPSLFEPPTPAQAHTISHDALDLFDRASEAERRKSLPPLGTLHSATTPADHHHLTKSILAEVSSIDLQLLYKTLHSHSTASPPSAARRARQSPSTQQPPPHLGSSPLAPPQTKLSPLRAATTTSPHPPPDASKLMSELRTHESLDSEFQRERSAHQVCAYLISCHL